MHRLIKRLLALALLLLCASAIDHWMEHAAYGPQGMSGCPAMAGYTGHTGHLAHHRTSGTSRAEPGRVDASTGGGRPCLLMAAGARPGHAGAESSPNPVLVAAPVPAGTPLTCDTAQPRASPRGVLSVTCVSRT
ncbi:hypothetical protein [Actinoplanes regularis]|uniref:hypothetical protein n=1 Tax=Actinoplanes regularis TaxID=52697 RepID=UPI0024A4D997|nr:hypothetical protein [Actinoplanes regularis]GLW30269.1 hypothetical protein Areg01_32090 [Actinoplanes regularis]